jgi:PAS domain S-box-containing protein
VSPIDLNRELGDIEEPQVPVMRVATPIYAADGKPFGALIVNIDMRTVFARVRAANGTGGHIYVVNERGDYLLNPDRAKEFGFEYDTPYRLQDDYAGLGALLKTDGAWDDVFADAQGRTLVASAVRVKFGSQTGAAIVKIVPYTAIMAPVWSIGYSALLGGLAVAVCAVVIAFWIGRSLTRPLRQMTVAVEAFSRNEPMTVPAQAGGEIGLLARTFQRMVVDMGEKTAQLRRETAERLRIFETSLDLIIVVDRQGNLIRVSPSAMMILGYEPAEITGHNASEYLYAEDLDKTRAEMKRLRRGQKMRNFEVRYVHKDGRIVTLAWAGVWSDPEQQYFFIGRDVTEQRFAEELFRLAVEASPSGMLMVDRGGRIVMVNSEFEQLFGYKREELMGRPVENLLPASFRTEHRALRLDYMKRPESRGMGQGRDLFGLRKDGSEFPIEIGLNPIKIRDGVLVLGVVVDISERKRTDRLKDEFVSTVSHELRTPLTSITASLALLSAGGAGALPPPAARLVSIAHNNGQRLVRLINDILDIEKIESGKMQFNFKRVNAGAVTEQAIEASRAYAAECGVNLRFDGGAGNDDIRADADRFAQVVSNLLSNAIKFSPSGEEVVVGVAERGNSVRVTVRDHGLGIPEEFKPRIFDKFAQADATDTRKKGGTGLGLSIVKQIVNRLGGDVGFESAVGQGTLFYVDLPRWRPGVDDIGEAAGHGHLIMLCEDDPDTAAILSAKISAAGFSVNVAATVGEALQQADTVTYAAVLVDLKLPDGDGIGLIQGLRSRPRYHDVPIVVVSGDPARGRKDSRSSALDILDWLDKPINIDRLLQTLDRSIAQNRNGYPRILHVDPDATVRKTVAEAMRRAAQVVSVATLEEARAAAEKKPFDLAVLDVALIAGAGPEILTGLHNADGHSIPVILLSAQGANPAYAERVSAALAGSTNSTDNVIEVLSRRLGIPVSTRRAAPGGGEAQKRNGNRNREEVA